MLILKNNHVINLDQITDFIKSCGGSHYLIIFYYNFWEEDEQKEFLMDFSSEKMRDDAFQTIIDFYIDERKIVYLDDKDLI